MKPAPPEEMAETTTPENLAEMDAAGDDFYASLINDNRPADFMERGLERIEEEADGGDA